MWHSESHGRLKKLIDDIIKENDWIVEGSPRKVFKESFDCCDNVIVLDEYTIIRLVRVFKRWIGKGEEESLIIQDQHGIFYG